VTAIRYDNRKQKSIKDSKILLKKKKNTYWKNVNGLKGLFTWYSNILHCFYDVLLKG